MSLIRLNLMDQQFHQFDLLNQESLVTTIPRRTSDNEYHVWLISTFNPSVGGRIALHLTNATCYQPADSNVFTITSDGCTQEQPASLGPVTGLYEIAVSPVYGTTPITVSISDSNQNYGPYNFNSEIPVPEPALGLLLAGCVIYSKLRGTK